MTDATPQDAPQADTPKTGFEQALEGFLEHQRKAVEEAGKAMDALLPPGFKEHSAVSRDEFRKGIKVVVDYAIDELEKLTKSGESEDGIEDETPPPSTTGRTKVKVEVE
ncbi:MAG: hypothetical protein ACOYL5_16620 [Phototrophicaceae bacterium]|jgi:hypothetical protein